MTVDFKVTMWERIHVPEGLEEKAREAVTSGEVTTGSELFELLNEGDERVTQEYLHDTEIYLTPEKNEEASTVEILEGDKTTWENGDPYKLNE